MPAAVVFDFDGVLLDSVGVKTAAFARLFEPEGAAARDAVVAYHLAHGGVSRYEKFRWAYREILKRPLDPGTERRLGEAFNALVEEAVLSAALMPGARESLEALHGRIPLFVASGTPEEELRRIVERRGLARFFRNVYGSPPDKEAILRRVASELGLAPSGLLMVGDSATDLEGARLAGSEFVGFVPPGARSPFPADVPVCSDLRELAARVP